MSVEGNLGDFIIASKRLRADVERAKTKEAKQQREQDSKKIKLKGARVQQEYTKEDRR